MALRARVDRHKCIGAATASPSPRRCSTGSRATTARPTSWESTVSTRNVLRAAAFSCPTAAVILEDVSELLPWQLRGKTGPARAGRSRPSCSPTSSARRTSSRRWATKRGRRCCAGTTRPFARSSRPTAARKSSTTGDGFFVSFDSPDLAVAAAIAIQRRLAEHRATQGFAPQVRIGLHASDATQVGGDFHGKGVHEAARIAALGSAGDIVASVTTVGEAHRTSGLRSATLRGLSGPTEVVNVDWR